MLDQLIYTRCFPHRDLKLRGQVVRSDGFGVFSVSAGLLSDDCAVDLGFLQARLAVPNGAKESSEPGLFSSYEYVQVGPDAYALTLETARPRCTVPRADGKSHRSGTYLKQCLIGKPEGRPADWFGASVWDAHSLPENDYYLAGEAAPPLLPQVSAAPQGGTATPERVRAFVRGGRGEAVRACLWFLLSEFDKPEEERRVLLIRDLPQNVELWIAAVSCGLSAPMARRLTFSTNRSRLGVQAESALFCGADAGGSASPVTRRPICMIAGFHPRDPFCAGVRAFPSGRFVLLDGETKTVSWETDASVHRPYYDAVLRNDEELGDFCGAVLPALPIREPTSRLPDLFDASRYLLDARHPPESWAYGETVRSLDALLRFGAPESEALSAWLLRGTLTGYPDRFAAQDEARGFPLLSHIRTLAGAARSALPGLFCGDALDANARQIEECSAAYAGTLLELYFLLLSGSEGGLASIRESGEKRRFVSVCLAALLDDRGRLSAALQALGAVPGLAEDAVLSAAQHLEERSPSRCGDWWEAVLSLGGGAAEVCRALCRSGSADLATVERLLAGRAERAGSFDRELADAFRKSAAALGRKPESGRLLFAALLRASAPGELPLAVSSIRESGLSPDTERALFAAADAKLPPGGFDPDGPVCRALAGWADALGLPSRTVSLCGLRKTLSRERRPERAAAAARAFCAKGFSADGVPLSGGCFGGLTAAAASLRSAELHLALLCLFSDTGDALCRYADAYAAQVLAATKKRELAGQLAALCGAMLLPAKLPGRSAAFVSQAQECLERAAARRLAPYVRPALTEQAEKLDTCAPAVREKLLALLREAGAKSASEKGVGAFLRRLFGKA